MIDDSKNISHKSFSIHYKTVGTGPVVLLIHGYGYNYHLWDKTLPHLKNFKVIMIELPGFGRSKNTKKYTLSSLSKAIIKWLKKERIDRYFVLGHSMGGYLAMEFVSKVPKRLLGVGLVHSLPYADDEETKIGRKKRVDHIQEHGLTDYLRGFYKVLLAPSFAEKNKGLIQQQYKEGLEYGNGPFMSGMDAMRTRKDRAKKLAKFKKPVLFIVGEEDAAYKYETSLKQLSIPKVSDVCILRGVGHMGMLEAPDQFNNAIINYLGMATAINMQN